MLRGHKAGNPEVRADLGSLGIKVRVNGMRNDSGMNIQPSVVGRCSQPDFAAIRSRRRGAPQAQVVPLHKSIQCPLERQILTVAIQIEV